MHLPQVAEFSLYYEYISLALVSTAKLERRSALRLLLEYDKHRSIWNNFDAGLKWNSNTEQLIPRRM